MEEIEKVILASSLCKEYRIGDFVIEALKELDLEVASGEFVSVYGPSGTGKTTLLNIIGGLDEPTGNLDLETGMEIVQMLEKLKGRGKTLIVATHDKRIMQLADWALRLKDGRVVNNNE